ncbi:gametocyte-specific factor 1 [Microcaecilia unicolor]|uniref:Gametocyte-specific factor 1-like n=1 Tax=Microcaecilia unicolor TaxID=1415580 RepID=A0A6P7X6W5_9AMPH|nr:gametocyte-specific factor 1-like [Microcaecilia unicolor]XP_030051332.1 gametocyte-specific factor 1-like [Microcaecilia unicolor]XP_030051333.1 gametocyte-specific factor 1-like [Microcaecilia unicolor]XP_030051334.1 gametocyte-specific factor 1-like [Microcaecilia unicolor]XP_030051335.1 gametocyte-specific factor 1-like [Microcaecilia unicolor]
MDTLQPIACPYNPAHKMSAAEFRVHMLTCKEKDTQLNSRFQKTKLQWWKLENRNKPAESMNVPDTSADTLDPEALLQCPYDSNHQIRACRFPYHLVKCRKNHPDVVKQLATCPFNARHLIPRAEIGHHISTCDDKSCIEQDIVQETRSYRREEVIPERWQPPPCDEDWDKELQEQPGPTFIWGTGAAFNSGISKMEPKCSLGSNIRVPKTLPYVLSWKCNTTSQN